MTRLADVMFRGKGYLYQMPWPPAGLAAATTAKSSPPQKDNCIDNLLSTSSRHDGVDLAHEGGTDGDQHSKLSSNNRMKDPPSSSVVDTTCSQNQYMDPHDVNEAGGDEAAPSENHHTLKSPVNRTKAVEVENSITHLNSAQHDLSEKASLDLDGDSARIEPVEMYPSHELTLQNAPAIPSVSCNVAIRIDKSETSNLQDNTTDGAEMFEPQNCDKAHQEVTCANNVSETDEEPGGQRKKLKTNETSNACPQELDQHISSPSSCSNPFVVESEIISTTIVRKNNLRVPCQKSSMGKLATTRYKPQNKDASICPQQGDPPRKPRWKEAAHPKGARTRSSHVVQCRNSSMGQPATTEKPLCKRNNLVRVNNLTDEEPGGQRKKLKTKATSNACPEELVQHIPSPSSCNPTTVHQNNPTVPFGNISMRQKATTQHARTNNAKTNLHVEDGNAMLECNSKGCKRMFSSISNLTRHRREVHKNGKCIPCGRCDKKFTRPENLKIHFGRLHNSMETCLFKGCTEEFPDKHARKTHEKSNQHVDDGTKKIKCHFKGCPKKYSSRKDQNRHYKIVHKSPGVQ
ncbi:sex-determining transformer protein 1-like [Lolium rigidum]|uniref:sex-determining transformer protein 1-like n=1 Tax=Lolium rigidum TaxID=89674 RepID=UPI001F5DF109|nr:sex-determining transformer protein 1-like [Lolium rigidum]